MNAIIEFFKDQWLIFIVVVILNFLIFNTFNFMTPSSIKKIFIVGDIILFILFAVNYPITLLINVSIIGMILNFKNKNFQKTPYQDAKAIFEGGGIRRGLTVPEVAVLLGKPINLMLSLIILQMLKKGFLEFSKSPYDFKISKNMKTSRDELNYSKREKTRRDRAQKLNEILTPYEEIILEFLNQKENLSFAEIDFTVVVEPIFDYVYWRTGGYDIEKSIDYYNKIILRSRIESRGSGNFISNIEIVLEKNILWVLLEKKNFDELKSELDYYLPDWLINPEIKIEEDNIFQYFNNLNAQININSSVNEFSNKFGNHKISNSPNLLTEIAKSTHS